MKISTTDLRRALDAILRSMEERGERECEITAEHYWQLRPEAKYDSYAEPSASTVTLGQLSDDAATLHDLVSQKKTAMRADLIGLAELLAAIGARK